MKNTIKKIWNAVNGVLIAVAMLLAIALVGVKLFGFEIFTVLSGSMEPVYMTGSIIYVKEVDADELSVGDDLTFRVEGGTVVTHRIIEIAEEEGKTLFYTKGVANDIADASPVSEDRIIGKPVFTIPGFGYFVAYIQSSSGRFATIAAGAMLLLSVILPDLVFGSDKKSKEN